MMVPGAGITRFIVASLSFFFSGTPLSFFFSGTPLLAFARIAAPGSKLDGRPASFRDCLPEGYSDGNAAIGPAIERDCRAVFCGE